MDFTEIGSILKTMRIKSGKTQDELALDLNCSRSCISKFECDRRAIDVVTFFRWVDVTKCHEIAVAMLYGVDGLTIINQLLPIIGGFATLFI